jgi:hypothetical protein
MPTKKHPQFNRGWKFVTESGQQPSRFAGELTRCSSWLSKAGFLPPWISFESGKADIDLHNATEPFYHLLSRLSLDPEK